MTDINTCPCGSGAKYDSCCGPLVDDGIPAPSAEALMRSRYVAYALGREEHLLCTWHPSTRPATLDLGNGPRVKWLGLTIVRTEAGGSRDDAGMIEFIARYKPAAGCAERLQEVSRFVKEDAQWFYVDGVQRQPGR